MRALDEMPEVEKTSLFGTAVHAVLREPRSTPADAARRGSRPPDSRRRRRRCLPSLEDVFLDVVEQSRGAAA